MNINAFLTCLSYYGVSTGTLTSLEGAYALSSGTTGIVFNQLYSSGAHFTGNQIYAPTIPLINVYGSNVTNSGVFSGTNGLRVGYHYTGDFGLILDIEYSGCYRAKNQRGMVLVSTAASPANLDSGFIIGITESNRLYFNTSGYSQTLDKELGTRDFVYVSSAGQQYATVGLFSLNDDLLYKQNIALPSASLRNGNIYLGNFLTSNSLQYTGFSGKINSAILFGDTLEDYDVGVCSNCSLATGFNTVGRAYSFLASQLTGFYLSGVSDYITTGYSNVTGQVLTHDGSTLNIITPSGLVGYLQTGQVAVPLFTGITVNGSRDDFVFLYDTQALNSFSTFSLYFNTALTSGDSIEVYSYPQSNPSIGKRLDGIDWPVETGVIQLIANGLNETLGIDYSIVRNQISGVYPDDILLYDVLTASPIVTAYSGYWNSGSRVQMIEGVLFPSASQYYENVTSFPGIVKITGLSGVCVDNPFYPNFGYDLHMNGQKLISGMYYDISGSGNGFVVSLSGNSLPAAIFYPLYDSTGGATGIENVDDSELAFIPEFSGFRQARTDVTGDKNTFSFFTGFGEQVWVNGIRQLYGLDYQKVLPCSLITGIFNAPNLSFSLYNSDAGNDSLWNLAIPPVLSLTTGGIGSMNFSGFLSSTNGYPTDGNCIEIWTSQLIDAQTFGPFVYAGNYASGIQISVDYTGWPTNGVGTGIGLGRYHLGNVMGYWTLTPPMNMLNSL